MDVTDFILITFCDRTLHIFHAGRYNKFIFHMHPSPMTISNISNIGDLMI